MPPLLCWVNSESLGEDKHWDIKKEKNLAGLVHHAQSCAQDWNRCRAGIPLAEGRAYVMRNGKGSKT